MFRSKVFDIFYPFLVVIPMYYKLGRICLIIIICPVCGPPPCMGGGGGGGGSYVIPQVDH